MTVGDIREELEKQSFIRESVDFFINKVLTYEANSNLGSLYNEREALHFCSEDTVDGFWVKTPLRITGKESMYLYEGDEEKKRRKLISASNLNKWLKFHPCQRVYMDLFNEYLITEFTKEEKEAFMKIESIKLYDKEKN